MVRDAWQIFCYSYLLLLYVRQHLIIIRDPSSEAAGTLLFSFCLLLRVQEAMAAGTLLFLLGLLWVQAARAAGTLLFSLELLLFIFRGPSRKLLDPFCFCCGYYFSFRKVYREQKV